MQIVLNSFGASLGKTGARFVVRRPAEPAFEVAAAGVEGIVLSGRGMGVSADAVALAAEHGAGITFTHPSGEPYARTVFENDLGRAALRREQYRAMDDARGAQFAVVCLQSKLRNQAATLRYFAKARRIMNPALHQTLLQTADSVAGAAAAMPAPGADDTADTLRNTLLSAEAHAARRYWGAVSALLPADPGFEGRVRRGAKDPVNASLNYAYGILHARVWAACHAAGLDPYAGYLHSVEDGKLALVHDLMEPFRAALADRPVFAALMRGWRPAFEGAFLDQVSRAHLAERVLGRLEDRAPLRGRREKLGAMILEKARELARFLRDGETPRPWTAPW